MEKIKESILLRSMQQIFLVKNLPKRNGTMPWFTISNTDHMTIGHEKITIESQNLLKSAFPITK